MASDLILGSDGLSRCMWPGDAPDYVAYHDEEWGRPVHGDRALFERLTLEAFQSGLSWLTILRKRDGFRTAFCEFDPEAVAAFGPVDVERLMAETAIIRNRRKIEATITNARALLSLLDQQGVGALDRLVWQYASPRPRPTCGSDVQSRTPESLALSRELKSHGFVFVGPTTAYAAMQACGLVDDHIEGCFVQPARATSR